ncbi:uncharacterized protein LOC125225085 isoform X2 [Leguminivora glycinivorella]|uniref:uncharacterized protein LOC125225085 isoform X2 n=1 Tax=Leguminivora glycinivorella TaxID=1035111 RepID=UPI00200FFD85|nr:uncharacterized protein LOC125225085 isoform X2 [Leguminivora glycinivorella]
MFSIRRLVPYHKNFQRSFRRYYSECSDKGSNKGGKDSSQSSSSVFSWYDARKYSHQLPGQDVRPPFDIPTMPSGVFRCTDGEIIGPQAGKCAYYRNPEYYCFHHMSFFDLHMVLGPSRKPQLNTGRKPTII